jgi:hypothetical protein
VTDSAIFGDPRGSPHPGARTHARLVPEYIPLPCWRTFAGRAARLSTSVPATHHHKLSWHRAGTEWRWLCNPSITNLRPPRTSPCVPARAPADRVHTDHRPEPNAPLRLWARAGNAAPGGWLPCHVFSRRIATHTRGGGCARHGTGGCRGEDQTSSLAVSPCANSAGFDPTRGLGP